MNMKTTQLLLTIIFSLFLCSVLLAQKKKTQKLSNFVKLEAKFEEKILTENIDLTAVELIKNHYAAKDRIYDHRMNYFNSYPTTWDYMKKLRAFNKNKKAQKRQRILKKELLETKKIKVDFLTSSYPNYRKYKNQLSSFN